MNQGTKVDAQSSLISKDQQHLHFIRETLPSLCMPSTPRRDETARRKERREGRREGPELQTRWFTRQDPSIPMSFRVKRNELWLFHSLLLMTAKTKKEMKT